MQALQEQRSRGAVDAGKLILELFDLPHAQRFSKHSLISTCQEDEGMQREVMN